MYCDFFSPETYPVYEEIALNTRRNKFSAAFGVQSAEKIFIAANVNDFVLFVTSDYIAAQQNARELSAYSKKPFVFLPPRQEVLLYKNEGLKSKAERFVTLYKVVTGQVCGVVTTPEGLGQLLPYAEDFKKSILRIRQTSYGQLIFESAYDRGVGTVHRPRRYSGRLFAAVSVTRPL